MYYLFSSNIDVSSPARSFKVTVVCFFQHSNRSEDVFVLALYVLFYYPLHYSDSLIHFMRPNDPIDAVYQGTVIYAVAQVLITGRPLM